MGDTQNKTWDALYILTGHWKSDLGFYRDDLRFLHHLIDRYFMWIVKTDNLTMVKRLKNDLLDLNYKGKRLLDKLVKHRSQLGYLTEGAKKVEADIIKKEHGHLEEEMAQFVKSFRENRKEVFAITEYVMDSEQLANILDS